MRYKLELSYFGKDFHGWQTQPNAISVQQTIEDAIEVVFRERVGIVGCGRTDTGVHARKYIAHFDSDQCFDDSFVAKLNNYLPYSIAVHNIIHVNENFHARFDAIKRSYEYQICLTKNPFLIDYSWFVYGGLNVEKMNVAAKKLLDFNDFTSFSKLHTDVKTNNCKIVEAFFTEQSGVLVFKISADRFLRNMVRAIVGTLVAVGKEKISIDDFVKIAEAKDRGAAGQSAPAEGLFLTDVIYPTDKPINR